MIYFTLLVIRKSPPPPPPPLPPIHDPSNPPHVGSCHPIHTHLLSPYRTGIRDECLQKKLQTTIYVVNCDIFVCLFPHNYIYTNNDYETQGSIKILCLYPWAIWEDTARNKVHSPRDLHDLAERRLTFYNNCRNM